MFYSIQTLDPLTYGIRAIFNVFETEKERDNFVALNDDFYRRKNLPRRFNSVTREDARAAILRCLYEEYGINTDELPDMTTQQIFEFWNKQFEARMDD